MLSEKMKDIIARKLANQCTDSELSELSHWISSSDRNRKIFEQYQFVWKYSAPATADHEFDKSAAWEKLQHRINRFESQRSILVPAQKPKVRILPLLARVAAVLVILFASWFMLKTETKTETVTITAEAFQDKPVVLPDGSKVFLNKGSQIEYSSIFSHTNRNIDFEGEGFFEVVADANNPFTISTSTINIKVVGTSFNLSALAHSDNVVLHLQTGKVLIYTFDKEGRQLEQMALIPGEKGVFNKKSGELSKSEFNNQNFLAWKTGIIEFNNTPLPEVLEVLENSYGLKFSTKRDCEGLLLTARFDNESPESIIQTLGFVFNLTFTKQGDFITIH